MTHEKWEYLTEILWASMELEGAAEDIKKRWPNWKNPPKHTPETLMLELDKKGEQGWELVHMQPVSVGRNSDVLISPPAGIYTANYFCVFKRRKDA